MKLHLRVLDDTVGDLSHKIYNNSYMKHLRKFNENKTDDIREFISDNLAFILDKDFAFDLSQSRYDDGNRG
jgi:hypothetical protein